MAVVSGQLRRVAFLCALAALLLVGLAACGGSGDDDSTGDATGDRSTDDMQESTAADDAVTDEEFLDALLEPGAVCLLVTDADATEILRPFGDVASGVHDYAYGGCMWELTGPDLSPDFTHALYVTILDDAEFTGLDPDPGVPIDDGPDGATWFERDGELWFDCGDGLHCGVIAGFDPVPDRLPVALAVAELVTERV